MLYSILIYEPEEKVDSLPESVDRARLDQHLAVQAELKANGQMGPIARLMPTGDAATIRTTAGTGGNDTPLILDGPFAETKEQLVGFYLIEAQDMEAALAIAGKFPQGTGAVEVRPVRWFHEGIL